MKHLTFDVGTNFDKNLINVIAENNKNNQFSSVFGKLKTDFLGGGRSSAFLPDITMEELRDYIELLKEAGFNQIEVSAEFGREDIEKQTERWFFKCSI